MSIARLAIVQRLQTERAFLFHVHGPVMPAFLPVCGHDVVRMFSKLEDMRYLYRHKNDVFNFVLKNVDKINVYSNPTLNLLYN